MKTALETWFASARPNDTFCYHVGTNLSYPTPADDATVATVRRLYDAGQVELVQRLIQPRPALPRVGEFEHLVVKRSVRDRRAPHFGSRPILDMAA